MASAREGHHIMQPQPSRRPRRARHLRSLLLLLAIFSLSLGMLGPIGSSVAQTTPPDNPASNYSMWRDDELFLPKLVSDQLTSSSYEYISADETLPELDYCQPAKAPGPQMAAAAGRVTSPYYDQVMVAYPYGAYLMVSLADECDLATGEAAQTAVQLGGLKYPMPALTAVPGLPRFYDITTGDLDRYSPDDTILRDEVVVAYAGISGELVVVVLDYATTGATSPPEPTVTWTVIPNAIPSNIVPDLYDIAPIPLAVTTGDFDGDGRKEIAVAYLNGAKTIGVAVYRYTTSKNANSTLTHALTQASALTSTVDHVDNKWTADHWIGSLDAVSGDFNGDGKDELSVAATSQGKTNNIFLPNQVAVNRKTFRADATLKLTQVNPNTQETLLIAGDHGKYGATVQLASGLFRFVPSPDAGTDFNIHRRQIALATNESSGAVRLKTIVYDTNLVPTVLGNQRIPESGNPSEPLKFRMAAGAFKGLRSAKSESDVVWSLAFATWDKSGQVLYLFDPNSATGALGTTPVHKKTVSTTAYPHYDGASIAVAPLVAYDYGKPTAAPDNTTALRGDAMYLSQPLHIVLEGHITSITSSRRRPNMSTGTRMAG
jgi:hypothetical protein